MTDIGQAKSGTITQYGCKSYADGWWNLANEGRLLLLFLPVAAIYASYTQYLLCVHAITDQVDCLLCFVRVRACALPDKQTPLCSATTEGRRGGRNAGIKKACHAHQTFLARGAIEWEIMHVPSCMHVYRVYTVWQVPSQAYEVRPKNCFRFKNIVCTQCWHEQELCRARINTHNNSANKRRQKNNCGGYLLQLLHPGAVSGGRAC